MYAWTDRRMEEQLDMHKLDFTCQGFKLFAQKYSFRMNVNEKNDGKTVSFL